LDDSSHRHTQLRKDSGVNVGRQEVVPELRSRIMRANRRRDTEPELAVRRALHGAGFRFRVDFKVQPSGGRSVRPDVVFTRRRVAVFVDGCYWHGCPEHGTLPITTNRRYWQEKIAENRRRDQRNTEALESDGWLVIRAWEHEAPGGVVERVQRALALAGH